MRRIEGVPPVTIPAALQGTAWEGWLREQAERGELRVVRELIPPRLPNPGMVVRH